MAHHVIYVPGLGDHHAYGQNIVIQYWRVFGLVPHYLPLGWNKSEGFQIKLDRLKHAVEKLRERGHVVSLVGVSAGASAVLNAFEEQADITATVLICGKVNHPETVHERTFQINPDFKLSIYDLQQKLQHLSNLQRARILSIHPWVDSTVPIQDTVIDGTNELTLPGWGHKSGIFFGVTLGGPQIARFIKRANKDPIKS